jgi:hypothetical protein
MPHCATAASPAPRTLASPAMLTLRRSRAYHCRAGGRSLRHVDGQRARVSAHSHRRIHVLPAVQQLRQHSPRHACRLKAHRRAGEEGRCSEGVGNALLLPALCEGGALHAQLGSQHRVAVGASPAHCACCPVSAVRWRHEPRLLCVQFGVPWHLFAASVVLGLFPYNFISVRAGTMLTQVCVRVCVDPCAPSDLSRRCCPQISSPSDVLDTWTMLQLIGLASAAVAPALCRCPGRSRKAATPCP